MTEPVRYLPLIDPNGKWIDRPDLYLIAWMANAEREEERVVHQLSEFMASADNSQIALNSFENDVAKREVRKGHRHRLFAGQVVWEAVRIAATTRTPASAKQAIKLCARGQLLFQKNPVRRQSAEM